MRAQSFPGLDETRAGAYLCQRGLALATGSVPEWVEVSSSVFAHFVPGDFTSLGYGDGHAFLLLDIARERVAADDIRVRARVQRVVPISRDEVRDDA